MKKLAKQLAAVSALALLGTSAQAAIIGANLGTEAIITFVNANNDSVSFDTGDLNVQAGDSYALPTIVVDFITAAGGVGNVLFGMIQGNSTSRSYVTTGSEFFGDVELGNSFRGTFASAVGQFAQDLNASRAASPTAQNDAYGPFLTGSGSPNYIDAGYDTWQTGNFELNNLGTAADPLRIFNVQFSPGSSQLGFATITARNDLVAVVSGGSVNIGPVVPVPAAIWLFGSGLGLLGLARRKVLA